MKQHHPDAGGDDTTILALNAAWEVLGDNERRRLYDAGSQHSIASHAPGRQESSHRSHAAKTSTSEQAVQLWLRQVYGPIDRLIAQVINPFAGHLKELAADPYDDRLMDAFCQFLEKSQARLERGEQLYQAQGCPPGLESFSLDLYHCLSLVKDALADLERYTMGYVDSYLRDGRELLSKAKVHRRQLLEDNRRMRA